MRSKEELNAIKGEAEALGAKLCKLSEDELEQVAGGRQNDPEIPEDAPACYKPAGSAAPVVYSTSTCNPCRWRGGCSRRP